MDQIINRLLHAKIATRDGLDRAKRQIAADFHIPIPRASELLLVYRKLIKKQPKKQNLTLEKLLRKREVRTLSGVAVIAVLTKPYPCPGRCAYCPSEKSMPKSYLSNEPAVMRAIKNKFDPYEQVKSRLKALEATGHTTDKCELIIMGGTWSYLPRKYQINFIKRCFDAFNGRTAKDLETAHKINETARNRCIGLTLETRPDYIDEKEIIRMRALGATRVELGVQHIDDKILRLNQRGHTVADTIEATKLLKQAGFKITYHLMPGLPGSTPTKDFQMFKTIFSDARFQPDQLKIYPCVVTRNSLLYKWWRQRKYRPYSDRQLKNILIKIKTVVPEYVRISRLIRDIPEESIIAGNKITNLRQILQNEKVRCRCIRCREIKNEEFRMKNLEFRIKKYKASEGIEYFLSYNDKKRDKLLAFLRLRIPAKNEKNFIPELQNAAMIRELHTYGTVIPVGRKSDATQHLGLGKKLIIEAEKIARKNDVDKLAVISGVGVVEYYQKQGFKKSGLYLIKNL